MPHVNIAIVDNKIEFALEVQKIIENKTDWPAKVTTEIFTNADDLIDAFDKQGKFYDVIITDVFMPARGEDPAEVGTPDTGAIRIKEWLVKKRKESKDFRHIQLRWLSRLSDVRPFLYKHVTIEDYPWLDYLTHHDKAPFEFEFNLHRAFEVAIRNSNPNITDIEMPKDFQFVSPAMVTVVREATRVAASDANVLITGYSGAGKERLAEYIHSKSHRAAKSFIKENCSAIPESLIESTLFGHVKGAFTGALQNRKGLLEDADGGTFFLDEIGDMPLEMQVKLLRVLEDKEFRRVGENTVKRSDFRFICATNKNLHQEIAAGRFREDLYYRIAVIELNIPPLKDRPDDIPILAEFFVQQFTQKMNKGLITIAPEVMELLKQNNWPGNVRELRNVVERAVVFLTGLEGRIEISHLPTSFLTDKPENELPLLTPEEQVVWEAVKASACNISKAAAILGKTRAAVHKYIHQQGKNGWVHPTLRMLFMQEKEAIEARTRSKRLTERAKLPLTPSIHFEENF